MAVYKFTKNSIEVLEEPTFAQLQIGERDDLQRLLRDQIEIIAPQVLVISEEFCDWDDSRRRIDLLAIDKDANLVVIELKRTEDGGHMDLQSIRYAAMISSMTFGQAVHVFSKYLKSRADTRDAQQVLLNFLGWTEPREDGFADDVRIVLASAEFSKEITTAVLWMRSKGIDIRCVRIKPYGTRDLPLLDVQQIVPLPEAEDYQIRVQEKNDLERVSRTSARDLTRYRVTVNGQVFENLPKRRVMLQVVKALIEAGISPETLAEDVPGRFLFMKFPGLLDGEQTRTAIQSSPQGDSSRWFTDDLELIHFAGSTYAISNQWGQPAMENIKRMIERCTTSAVRFDPMG